MSSNDAFATGGRRGRRRGRRSRGALSEINVTPLVDVMLMLLIIFMVTAPLLVSGVPVNLPETRAKGLDQDAKPPGPQQGACDLAWLYGSNRHRIGYYVNQGLMCMGASDGAGAGAAAGGHGRVRRWRHLLGPPARHRGPTC